MKRAMRWVGFSILGILGLVAAGIVALLVAFPRVGPAPELKVEVTSEKLARGAYLAENVAICMDCHSERDFGKFAGPLKRDTLGKGGEKFGHDHGFPGTLVAPNITPAALSDWSDGELARAITTGVTPDGRALFPFMNWPAYATMCKDDLEAVIAYVRSLSPIEHETERTSLDFPVNLIVRTMPQPATPPARCSDAKDGVEHGRYLAAIASCAECHSPRKGPDIIPELAFSGNVAFPLPGGGVVRSANITPDAKTGIGRWTREQFIDRFARYRNPANLPDTQPGAFNTIMPWPMYANMTDEDLGAIYDYLRTLKPVEVAQQQRFAAK